MHHHRIVTVAVGRFAAPKISVLRLSAALGAGGVAMIAMIAMIAGGGDCDDRHHRNHRRKDAQTRLEIVIFSLVQEQRMTTATMQQVLTLEDAATFLRSEASSETEADDPQQTVRALGSLAQELMDSGVGGVVAMRPGTGCLARRFRRMRTHPFPPAATLERLDSAD